MSFSEFWVGPLADFFNTSLIHNSVVFIDIYSIVHFITGFLLMFLIFKIFKKVRIKFFILFLVVILWEVFELAVIATGSSFFRLDSKLNALWDLIIGMMGGYLYWHLKEKRK